jgi:hypothetical protein
MAWIAVGSAAVGLTGSIITGVQNNKKNKALASTQRQAQADQKAAQEQYRQDYGAYQKDMRNLLGDRPELNLTNNQDALQPYLSSVQNDLMASQGRAAGSEVRRDDIRQNSADQIYRAQQASRTGSDLMGAIGRIQAGEYANARELGGREAQERVNRIDNKTTAFQNAIKENSMFNINERARREAAMYQNDLDRFNQSFGFEQSSQANLLNTNLNFSAGNIAQNAAIGQANANMMVNGFGDSLNALGNVGMQYAIQDQQIQLDAAKYNSGINNKVLPPAPSLVRREIPPIPPIGMPNIPTSIPKVG